MDITKCKGKDCPLKETCYRYTAKASGMQSYFSDDKVCVIDDNHVSCEHYWSDLSNEDCIKIIKKAKKNAKKLKRIGKK